MHLLISLCGGKLFSVSFMFGGFLVQTVSLAAHQLAASWSCGSTMVDVSSHQQLEDFG